MPDNISNANRSARDPQRRITAATAIGMNALKPIMHFQVSMLRMWADSIERFAGNYEKGVGRNRDYCRGTVRQATRRVMSQMRLGGVRVGSIVSARPPLTSSGLRPTADIRHQGRHFRKVPIRDSCTAANQHLYSMTSSARMSSDGGTVRPSAFAVLRLILSSNLVGW
jgi:hypothetical protein